MQVLKDEVRDRIHRAALIEFKEKGFQKASMRSIAKRAGMTVGNLYRYFKDKTDLFHKVVSPAYARILELIESIEDLRHLDSDDVLRHMVRAVVGISKECHYELLILIDGSMGTDFSKAKDEVIMLAKERIEKEVFNRVCIQGSKIEGQFLAEIIAHGYIDGIARILRQFENDQKLEKVLMQFHDFYFKNVLDRFS